MRTLLLLPSPELLRADKLAGGPFWKPPEGYSVGSSA